MHLPRPLFLVVGYTPVAESLARVAAASLEYDVVRIVVDEESRDVDDIDGVRVTALGDLKSYLGALDSNSRARMVAIVASQGHYDEAALETILAGPVAFVGLLASRKRAATVFGVLRQHDVAQDRIAAIRNPVGLAIGARSAAEVAVSILAEIIASAPVIAQTIETESGDPVTTFATDPVCGMDVEVGASRLQTAYDGRTYFFCGAGCRSAFAADPNRFAATVRID
jgi:xanthine dehydrogenase accessory factor